MVWFAGAACSLARDGGNQVKVIAIIGGGPAGAMAAERLAHGGAHVTVFEEKLGWEKPCGSGLSPQVLRAYPFLRDVIG